MVRRYEANLFLLILLFFLDVSFTSSQTSVNPPFAQYGIYDLDGIKSQEYQQRRAAVIAKMDSGSYRCIRANDPGDRNGGTDYRFRQNDNFLLNRLQRTNSTADSTPNGIRIDSVTIAKAVLFVNGYAKSWSGPNLGLEGAKQVLGFGAEGTKVLCLQPKS